MEHGGIRAFDELIRASLTSFAAHLAERPWRGKEHECVNFFAHGFLIPLCAKDSVLNHPTQVAIEVCVAQPPGFGTKVVARKDLVIWPRAWMTCFDEDWQPVQDPAVVMEWKLQRAGVASVRTDGDERFLSALTDWKADILGFSVHAWIGGRSPGLKATRFCNGSVDADWFVSGSPF